MPVSCKRSFDLSTFILIALVAQSWFVTKAQTPDSKPRGTASITGRVTIGEKPASGVIIAVMTLNAPQTLVAQTVSDSEGKYRISGLPPGQLNVGAVAPSFVKEESSGYFPGRVLNFNADEALEGIDFKLTRGSVITGRVTDADSKPVIGERIQLALVDEKGEPSRAQLARAANPFMFSTDDRGIYRIYGLGAGRYKVSAGDNGGGATLRAGFYARTYYPDTTEVAKATIVEVAEGAEAKNIDITLGARSRTYAVSGHITDADTGAPVVGTSYAFGPLQQSYGQTGMAGYTSPPNPTNSKGEFRLEGVAPGRYAVTTVRGFGLDPTQPKVYSDPLPFEVVDSDVTDLEVKAHRGLTISGTVVTEAITSRAALAGVSHLIVSGLNLSPPNIIQPSSGFTTSPIAADGSFQLEGLRPGKVNLNIGAFTTAESRGYTISRITEGERELPNRQLELAEGQSASGIRIFIQYGNAVIKGEVKITGGTLPAETSLVVILQRENQNVRVTSAQVDARGRFVLSGISAGTYDAVLQVIATANVAPNDVPRPQHQTVTVSDDSETQITFTLDLTRKEGL